MTVSENLYAALNADAGVRALIGEDSPVRCRIYPLIMPQGVVLPALVYQDITSTRMNTIADAGGNGVERFLFQITAWGKMKSVVDELIDAVDLAIKTSSLVCVLQSSRGFHDADTRLFSRQRDYSIWHHY